MTNVEALDIKAEAEKINTGLSDQYRREMSQSLTDILAGTYHLTIKSHVYHWNVSGPLFKSLHELTEEHYEALFQAADVIAERIRALGHLAPVNLADAGKFAPKGGELEHRGTFEMVEDLIQDHEAAVREMRKAAGLAGDEGDVVTEDMLTQHLTFHEKVLWMLRAIVAS